MDIISMKSFSKQMNDMTFTDYYYRLMLLSRSVFKWENLPNGMDEKWIEKFLFTEGKCMFFKDPEKGFMVTKCTDSSTLNYYEEPTELRPYALNYEGDSLVVGKDCVLIRNNDEMIPTSYSVKLFAYRLAELTRTMDVNINAQKTPVLIIGSEKQKLSLKNIYAQWDGFEPVIYGDKSLDSTDLMKVLKTDAPVVFPQLQAQKQTLWNECLTFLGINNANTEKRERLITNEVEANDNHIDLSADCLLKAREKACEQINELFGLNISVSLREGKESDEECMQDIQNTSEI